MNRIKCLVAAPLVSAGILVGVTLAGVGTAGAVTNTDGHAAITVMPDTRTYR